jgi:hypothetical protein
MNVTRAIAYGVVGRCKTEASQKPVPLHPILAEALTLWRQTCSYCKPEDWVFASRQYRGRKPLWGQAILRKHVRPVAARIGIQRRIGWHTFRKAAIQQVRRLKNVMLVAEQVSFAAQKKLTTELKGESTQAAATALDLQDRWKEADRNLITKAEKATIPQGIAEANKKAEKTMWATDASFTAYRSSISDQNRAEIAHNEAVQSATNICERYLNHIFSSVFAGVRLWG